MAYHVFKARLMSPDSVGHKLEAQTFSLNKNLRIPTAAGLRAAFLGRSPVFQKSKMKNN